MKLFSPERVLLTDGDSVCCLPIECGLIENFVVTLYLPISENKVVKFDPPYDIEAMIRLIELEDEWVYFSCNGQGAYKYIFYGANENGANFALNSRPKFFVPKSIIENKDHYFVKIFYNEVMEIVNDVASNYGGLKTKTIPSRALIKYLSSEDWVVALQL